MYADEWWSVAKFAVITSLLGFGIHSCRESEWHKRGQRENAAREAADLTPRVVREFDGCKVWAFKTGRNGHWTYVTKCPGGSVTTDSGRTVQEGSGRSRRDITVREITTTKEN